MWFCSWQACTKLAFFPRFGAASGATNRQSLLLLDLHGYTMRRVRRKMVNSDQPTGGCDAHHHFSRESKRVGNRREKNSTQVSVQIVLPSDDVQQHRLKLPGSRGCRAERLWLLLQRHQQGHLQADTDRQVLNSAHFSNAGNVPNQSLIIDSKGNLFGTALGGHSARDSYSS